MVKIIQDSTSSDRSRLRCVGCRAPPCRPPGKDQKRRQYRHVPPDSFKVSRQKINSNPKERLGFAFEVPKRSKMQPCLKTSQHLLVELLVKHRKSKQVKLTHHHDCPLPTPNVPPPRHLPHLTELCVLQVTHRTNKLLLLAAGETWSGSE